MEYQYKQCLKCKLKKTLNYFGTRTRNSDGKRSRCKECEIQDRSEYLSRPEVKEKTKETNKIWYARNALSERKRQQEWASKNKEHLTNYRRKKLLSEYGISIAEYEKRFFEQKQRCAICNSENPGRGNKHFHVDHCHKTNIVRGLLCTHCNLAIGQMGDNPARMRRAADYVEKCGLQ